MNRHNMEHTLLDHKELADKYPMFKFSAEYRALYDPLGTVLYSNKCVQVLQVIGQTIIIITSSYKYLKNRAFL